MRLQDLEDEIATEARDWFSCPYVAFGEVKEHSCSHCAPYGRQGLVPSGSLRLTWRLARRVADLFNEGTTGVRSSARLAKILGEDTETAAALYRYLLGEEK